MADQRTDQPESQPGPWKCFHCGYVARTVEEGIRHFGIRGEEAECRRVEPMAFDQGGTAGRHPAPRNPV